MSRNSTGGLSTASFVTSLMIVLVVGALFIIFVIPPENVTPVSTSSTPSASVTTPASSSTVTSVSTSHSTSPSSTSISLSSAQIIPDPSIRNGSATITFSSDYAQLANFTLNLVNKDRAKAGLAPVSLSPVQSGQQHADSMLYFGYFSHWDTQGFKPYMRYSLLGGAGAVEENVAFEHFPSHFRSTSDVEQVISGLENQMMVNDSACCQNGHRDNILSPNHNRISMGIAYNESYVYLVQDFENYLFNFSQPILSGNTVSLDGPSSARLGQLAVYVFYDKSPAPLSPAQLNKPPYQQSYDQGIFIGGVVPPCSFSCITYPGNITVTAQTWKVSSSSANIVFSLSDFTRAHGRGVYSVLLVEKATRTVILFDLSIFVDS